MNDDREAGSAAAPSDVDEMGHRDGRNPVTEEERDGDGTGFKVFDRRFWAVDEENDRASDTSDRSQAPTYIERLENQLAEKERQLKEYIKAYKDEVKVGLAETKERLARDAEQQRRGLIGEVAQPMMEVLEALERSLQMASGSDPKALIEGVQLVQLLMVRKLKELGLERIETVGQVFDPSVHEAVAVAAVDSPEQDKRIVAELTPGFISEGRVVRAAKVQVGQYAG